MNKGKLIEPGRLTLEREDWGQRTGKSGRTRKNAGTSKYVDIGKVLSFSTRSKPVHLSTLLPTEVSLNLRPPLLPTGRDQSNQRGHRKSVSLVSESQVEQLFLKVSLHRRLSSDLHPQQGRKSHHRSSSIGESSEFPGLETAVPPQGEVTKVNHSRNHSLNLDLDNLQTEFISLPNCSTKKILPKSTQQLPDSKVIAYLRRYLKVHGKAPAPTLNFYHLGPLIGQGAFSIVYFAVQRLTNLPVAVKSIQKTALADAKNRREIIQEIETMRFIRHPSLVRLYEIIETKTQLHLVMEYLSGGSLASYLKTKGKMTEKQAKMTLASLATGLQMLHKHGIVHRDVKLDNVLVEENATWTVKLADFGVSKRVKSGERLIDKCGTPAYLAPEILTQRDYAGEPADVWSLGVTLYALLCGHLPFKGLNLTDLHRTIQTCAFPLPISLSKPAQDLISQILIPDPTLRISISGILRHPWLREIRPNPDLDPEIRTEVVSDMKKLGFSIEEVTKSLQNRELTHATAVYELLTQVM